MADLKSKTTPEPATRAEKLKKNREKALALHKQTWRGFPSISDLTGNQVSLQIDRVFSFMELSKDSNFKPAASELRLQSDTETLPQPTGLKYPSRIAKLLDVLARISVSKAKSEIISVGINFSKKDAIKLVVSDNGEVSKTTVVFLKVLWLRMQCVSTAYKNVNLHLTSESPSPAASTQKSIKDEVRKMSALIVAHAWAKLNSRLMKRFDELRDTLLSFPDNIPGLDEECQRLLIENFAGPLVALKDLIGQERSNVDISMVITYWTYIACAARVLETKEVWNSWTDKQTFPFKKYFAKLCVFYEDIEFLHKFLRSPKFRYYLEKPIEVIPLPASEKGIYDHWSADPLGWQFTIDLMIKHVNDNLPRDAHPWHQRHAKVDGTIKSFANDVDEVVNKFIAETKQITGKGISNVEKQKMRKKFRNDKDAEEKVDIEQTQGRSKLAVGLYYSEKCASNGSSRVRKIDTVHSELKVIEHILAQKDNSWFNGIGISKLCCRSCYMIIHALNQALDDDLLKFYVRGSHHKLYFNVKYPQFISLTGEQRKSVAVAAHLEASRFFIERFEGAHRLLVQDPDSESEPPSSPEGSASEYIEGMGKVVPAFNAKDIFKPGKPGTLGSIAEQPENTPKRGRQEFETDQEGERAAREGSPTKKAAVEAKTLTDLQHRPRPDDANLGE